MNKNVIIYILIGIIVVGGVFVYASTLKKVPVASAPTVETTAAPVASSGSSNSVQAQPSAPVQNAASSNSKNCGASLDCFIAQAATCGPAIVEGATFGPSSITANFSVKKTATANVCSVTESAYGTTQACVVPANKLVPILTDFKQGNSGSDSLTNYNCTTTTSDGTSIDTTTTSKGSAVATHGYTYTETEQAGGSFDTSAFSYNVLTIGTNSMTMTFTNNQTNQSETLTLQQNVPVTFAKYTITLKAIDQNGATFTLTE